MATLSNRKPELRAQFIRAYLELDMLADAREELAQFTTEERTRLDVLDAGLEFATRLRDWAQVVDLGEKLARGFPEFEGGWIGWAYALRELQRIEEARAVLLEAEPLHGKRSAVLHYNLACYHALLGELDIARERLRRACKLAPKFKQEALADPDLAALR